MSVAPTTSSLPTVSSPIVWKRSPSGEKNLIELVAESVTIMLPISSRQNEVGLLIIDFPIKNKWSYPARSSIKT